MLNVEDLLNQKDPLDRAAAEFLVSYKEEDDRVDYKESFDTASEKHWLELTKDVASFANTYGGYLVFGISDGDKELIGLGRSLASALKDVNNIHQKLNRHLDPDICALRSKAFRFGGKTIVILLIPRSTNLTHVIKKDGSFRHPSGKDKVVLRQGTFYVRRSGGNHLGDSRDLDGVVERRFDQFRSQLMDKVARVVSSPTSSDVFILSKDPQATDGERFIIEDSPEALPVKGMSFTIPPEDDEQEVAAWSVICRGNSQRRPPPSEVWKWYANRESLEVHESHRLSIFRFSLWDQAPSFYWIKDMKAEAILGSLIESIRGRPANVDAKEMLIVASFLGKGAYTKALSALGGYRERLAPAMKSFPTSGPQSAFGTIRKRARQTEVQLRAEQLRKLNAIADDAAAQEKEPGLQKRWEALKIDCFLYARDDKYVDIRT